jgi:hypothetical protein
VTASWSIPAEGIRPRNGILQLAPNSTTVLQVEGVLAAAGTYVSTLDVLDAGATGKVFSVAITRTVAAVPPELLVEPRPARIDIPFPRLRSPDPGVVRLTAHNATAGTVDVHKAVIGRFSALDGDVETTVAGPGTPSVASDGCGGQIESQKTCTVAISFPADLSAGRYAADIVIGGPGGNQSARTVLLDVRLSPWWAGLVIAGAALAGYLVNQWRERGRNILDRRIALAEVQVGLVRLVSAAKSAVVREQARRLQETVRAIEDDIAANRDPTPRLGELGARYDTLVKADNALTQAAQPEASRTFGALAETLANLLRATDWKVDDVAAAVGTLEEALARFPDLVTAANACKTALEQLRPFHQWVPAHPAVAEAQSALTAAFQPAQAGPDLTERAKTLNNAVKELESREPDLIVKALSSLMRSIDAALPGADADRQAKLNELKAELAARLATGASRADAALLSRGAALGLQPGPAAMTEAAAAATVEIPRALPADTGLTLDFNPFLFGLGSPVPPARLLRIKLLWDIVTNLVVLLGIGLAGVLALWVPDSAWGSVTDLVTAALAGIGTRLAIGTISQPAAK